MDSSVLGGPVTLGVFLLAGRFPGWSGAQAISAATGYAVAAERAGLAGAQIAEHHFISYGTCPSAVAFAAHILGRTSAIEVGTAACVLSARHPVALAEETALLDQVSGGRCRLGVGRGGPWLELEVLGTGLPRYQRGFAESLDLLLRWLTEPRVGADGSFFRFEEATVVPRPLTRPRPPVWVAATSPATVDLAAARELPLLLGMHEDNAGRIALLTRYARTAAEHGHDPDRVEHAAAVLGHVADSTAEARRVVRGQMPGWLAEGVGGYVRLDGSPGPRRDPSRYVDHLISTGSVGTVEHCVDRLAETVRATGIRRYLLMVEASGEPERVGESIARFGGRVAPMLRAAIGTGETVRSKA